MRKYKNSVAIPENRRLYTILQNMKKRCYDEGCDRYQDYGGRGIKICDDWLNSFDNFVDWAKDNGYQNDLTIDRIDNNGDYCPENCRWQTIKEQNMNKRTTFYAVYHGVKKPLKVWCDELDLPYDSVHNRITKIGMSVEEAFEKPFGEKSFAQLCREHNMKPGVVYDRVHKFGWTIEDALNTPSFGRGSNKCRATGNYGTAICKVCGKSFKKNNGKQCYCGEKCRKISLRKSFRETGLVIDGRSKRI